MNTENDTSATYSYYVDIEGQGGPRYGTLDFEMLANIEPKYRGKVRSAIFLDRIVGINLRRETSAALYNGSGQLLADLKVSSKEKPRKTRPSKWLDMHEDVTYRFEFESEEPIDLETFEIQAVAYERHGGTFLTSIEINGHRIDPARFPAIN